MPEHKVDPAAPFQSFQEEANTVAKLSPREIRRLGDRRRTTRRVGIVGGLAAACVAAVTAVALNLPGRVSGGPEIGGTPSAVSTRTSPTAGPTPTPSPSGQPSGSSTPTPQPTWANVPGASLMFPQDPQTGRLSEQYEGLGQAGLGLCDPGNPAQVLGSGAQPTILTRTFTWVDGVGSDIGRTVRVVGLESPEQASAVYQLYVSTANACASRYQDDAEFHGPRVQDLSAQLPFDGSSASQPARAAFVSMTLVRRTSDEGRFNEVMVVQAGSRVMVVTSTFDGMDNNCGPTTDSPAGQCDLPASLPAMLQLLDA